MALHEDETILGKQEKQWIIEQRVIRLTDNKEVQIYPMGAERFLSSILFGEKNSCYDIRADIEGKNVLVIPGHGNSGFLFAQAGAKSVTVYDKDPVTIAWIKAFKKYYYYREQNDVKRYPSIGELLSALTCWYPPLLELPFGKYIHMFFWLIQPNTLRRVYIHYALFLARQAIQSKTKEAYEFEKNLHFHSGTIETITREQLFDTAFVPYLLGVKNGIETEKEIIQFMRQLFALTPGGRILVNPSRNTKEFYCLGKRYLETIPFNSIQSIPALASHYLQEDKNWFRTQGLVIFKANLN